MNNHDGVVLKDFMKKNEIGVERLCEILDKKNPQSIYNLWRTPQFSTETVAKLAFLIGVPAHKFRINHKNIYNEFNSKSVHYDALSFTSSEIERISTDDFVKVYEDMYHNILRAIEKATDSIHIVYYADMFRMDFFDVIPPTLSKGMERYKESRQTFFKKLFEIVGEKVRLNKNFKYRWIAQVSPRNYKGTTFTEKDAMYGFVCDASATELKHVNDSFMHFGNAFKMRIVPYIIKPGTYVLIDKKTLATWQYSNDGQNIMRPDALFIDTVSEPLEFDHIDQTKNYSNAKAIIFHIGRRIFENARRVTPITIRDFHTTVQWVSIRIKDRIASRVLHIETLQKALDALNTPTVEKEQGEYKRHLGMILHEIREADHDRIHLNRIAAELEEKKNAISPNPEKMAQGLESTY